MICMADANDMDLVREYGARQSEPAFAELVQRHINLVYSVALRQLGNPAQAEEITQAVFIILARKAAHLRAGTVLPAWLHETTRHVVATFLRGEIRRRRREQEAFMQSTLQPISDDSAWEQLAPLLDEAIGRLGTADRNVVVLRYFQNKSALEIATALNIGEAAAKKRLARAVEKLRRDFGRRGINLSSAALSGAVFSQSVHLAPAPLAKTVTSVALAKGAATSVSTLTLVKGALRIMAWTKAKIAVVAGVAVILAATATTAVVTRNDLERGDSRVSVSVLYKTNAPNDPHKLPFYVFSVFNRDSKPVRMRGSFTEIPDNPILMAPVINFTLPWPFGNTNTVSVLEPGQSVIAAVATQSEYEVWRFRIDFSTNATTNDHDGLTNILTARSVWVSTPR
jgi:RNA polymerase sigma factor (sigma-70 family)